MAYKIPDIVLKDAKDNGFLGVRFGGEYDGIPYFVYEVEHKFKYNGLPVVVMLIDGNIEVVKDLESRLIASNYREDEK